MNLKWLFDSKFRYELIHDPNTWFIFLGISYFFLLMVARNWVMKKFKPLLIIAIGLFIIGTVLGFIVYRGSNTLGALDFPLITLLYYKGLYEWFKKKFKRAPKTPLETSFRKELAISKDQYFNMFFFITAGWAMGGIAYLIRLHL